MNVTQVEDCCHDHNDDDGDRISKLPDEILCLIISFLSMREATGTRLLSRQWRSLCASASNLHFDLLTVCGIYCEKYYTMHSKFLKHKTSFLRGIDQFSCLYLGPRIDTFWVCFLLGYESASHIDKWIGFAIQMGAKNIDLDLFGYKDSERYNFPCHLLPQGERSHLKSLCVTSCLLRPSPDNANRFNSLTNLDLSGVNLEKIHLDCILSGCLNLERLKFQNCWLPQPFRIHGSLCHLKTLINTKHLRVHWYWCPFLHLY
uniref:F-box domain-containing protein n=1 Tax=Rhizophora mucronata TaxID=61149 RepID=A0A2P2K592_RHIMU